MASKGFTFPPPPPPPPNAAARGGHIPAPFAQPEWRGRGRGRGRGMRASSNIYGNNGHSRSGYQTHSNGSPWPGNEQHGGRGAISDRAGRGHKRPYSEAFSRSRPGAKSSHPQVPSYGSDISALLSTTRSSTAVDSPTSLPASHPVKRNVFGLAPALGDLPENDDADEEGELAQAHQRGTDNLQVTYHGQTMSLNTPQEIAAWIAERRKRFPTKAKAEEAKAKAVVEAEEKARQRKEKAQLREQRNKNGHDQSQKRKRGNGAGEQCTTANTSQERRLQRELEIARKRIAELEQAATPLAVDHPGSSQISRSNPVEPGEDLRDEEAPDAKPQSSIGYIAPEVSLVAPNQLHKDVEGSLPIPTELTVDTSSSAASSDGGSDSDDGPPEISSKRIESTETTITSPKNKREPQICRDFAKMGRCPRGRRCHFKHEPRPQSGPHANARGSQEQGSIRGKSLYQRLQDQEQAIAEELVLKHIMYLGDKGMLEKPPDGSLGNRLD